MDTRYYKLDSPMRLTPEVHRYTVLLTIVTKLNLALVLIIVYCCMAAF
jgi:hypothetical protein